MAAYSESTEPAFPEIFGMHHKMKYAGRELSAPYGAGKFAK